MLVIVLTALVVLAAWVVSLIYGLSWWMPALVTGLVVVIVVARVALRRYRGARAEREIERTLAAQAAQFEQRARPDQQAEVKALAAQFEQALQTLRSSKLAHGRGGALYSLPWYVIIGPPGAGKSTA